MTKHVSSVYVIATLRHGYHPALPIGDKKHIHGAIPMTWDIIISNPMEWNSSIIILCKTTRFLMNL